jgi:hypothetical protein
MQFLYKVITLIGYLWNLKGLGILFQKGAQIPKYRIFGRYIEFLGLLFGNCFQYQRLFSVKVQNSESYHTETILSTD